MPPPIVDIRHPEPASARGETPAQLLCRQWYQTYGRALYNYLRFQVASADLAEDLVAEVFLRAVRGADSFDPARGDPRAWLFRIAQNALRDHIRQIRRRPNISLAAFRDLAYQAPSPEERLLWEEEVARLMEALATLSFRDQEIIGLCYGSQLTPGDAGEILGIRGPSARMRLWRALRRLREALGE